MASICTWTGLTGNPYPFEVYELPRGWQDQPKLFLNALPGIYIFTNLGSDGYVAIYIGQTSNISERFPHHHKIDEIKNHVPTHIHLHVNHKDEYARLDEERDLIENYKPVLNERSVSEPHVLPCIVD